MKLVNFSSDTRYTYTVARIRVLETLLLNNKMFRDIADSATIDNFFSILEKHRYPKIERGQFSTAEFDRVLSFELDNVLTFIYNLAIDKEIVDIFYYQNDLENIYTLLVKGGVEDKFFLKGKFTQNLLSDIIKTKRVDMFPSHLRKIVITLLTTQDYNYFFDFLHVAQEISLKYNNEFLYYMFTEEENIIKVKLEIKNKILCNNKIDDDMIRYPEYKNNLKDILSFYEKYNSLSILDKINDDILTSIYRMTKLTCFGIEPLISYYWAKRVEIINLRLIYLAKITNIPADYILPLLRNSFVN